ncbi:hypothetical protein JB92DRAFT_2838880 [Gautieria morchelliformis]|nr:hypothetical protein JB92DRAFT_2838880 [Gautieria morchelliformis]
MGGACTAGHDEGVVSAMQVTVMSPTYAVTLDKVRVRERSCAFCEGRPPAWGCALFATSTRPPVAALMHVRAADVAVGGRGVERRFEATRCTTPDKPLAFEQQCRVEIRVPVQEADALRQHVAGVPLAVGQDFVEHHPFTGLAGFCHLCEMSSAEAGRARAGVGDGIRRQEDESRIMAMRRSRSPILGPRTANVVDVYWMQTPLSDNPQLVLERDIAGRSKFLNRVLVLLRPVDKCEDRYGRRRTEVTAALQRWDRIWTAERVGDEDRAAGGFLDEGNMKVVGCDGAVSRCVKCGSKCGVMGVGDVE